MSKEEISILKTLNVAENLHHAYGFAGERSLILSFLFQFIEEKLKIKKQGNPDFWFSEFDTFGIDESRSLKESETKKSLGGKKVFILAANFLTREAQNALLKILEEPRKDNVFFIIIPSFERLLPTLRSRLMLVKDKKFSSKKEDELVDPEKFMASFLAKRMEIVEKISKSISEREESKERAVVFLDLLEERLRESIKENKFSREEIFALSEILKCKSYLSDRAPSVKMILEHIALILPRK